jgi:hypothetical protein
VQALLRVTRSMGEATLVRHLLPALLGVLTPPSPPPPASHNFNAAAAPAGEHNGPLSPKLPDWTLDWTHHRPSRASAKPIERCSDGVEDLRS